MTSVQDFDVDNVQTWSTDSRSLYYRCLAKELTYFILRGPRKDKLTHALRWFEYSPKLLIYTMHTLNQVPAVEWPIFDAIPIIRIDYSQLAQSDTCAMCKIKFHPLEAVKVLPCLHYYHETCLANWCQENDDCPYQENGDDEKNQCGQKVHFPMDPDFLWRNDMLLQISDVLFEKHRDFFLDFLTNNLYKPVSKRVVKNLHMIQSDPQDECAICFEQFQTKAVQLPCTHKFHDTCIQTWFKRTNTCPFCRCEME